MPSIAWRAVVLVALLLAAPVGAAGTASAQVPPTFIHRIQGAAHVSPLRGQLVGNAPGVVTARRSNGFYVQDPNPDADERTSEAIFVFTSAAPLAQVGDAVAVRGTVSEFRPGGSGGLTNLTTTQLTSSNANVTVLSSGNPLPAPLVIGAGGRRPPTEVIEDDASGDVETSGVFDPSADGIDFYESLEGMRVQVNDAVVVGPRNGFGEIVLVGDSNAAAVRTARGGLVIRPNDFNPERIMLDDGILPTPPVDVGDRFAGPVVGVVDYSFGNFKLQLTQPLAVVPGGLTREVTGAPAANQLALATFNVENLDPNDGAAKFDALAGLIVGGLRAPDLIALEEVQDNNGPVNDAVVDAGLTYQALIAAVQRAGGPSYDYRQIDPVDDRDGGEPGGNIRVGFMFRTDRGLRFVDRPGGGPTTATTVVAGPAGPELSASPGRVDPTNAAFADSRKPLAGEFLFRGRKLFVVANHFNSKGGDQPLFGRFQPPARPSEVQRHQQARIVHDFADGILAVDPDASVVVLGDLNDFDFSETLRILEGAILVNLMDSLPLAERYSYVFEGNSQVLDQVLVSRRLASQPFVYDVVHVNAEFADQLSDHEPQVARFTFDTEAPTLSASAAPAPNPAGWNDTDVTVSLSAADESDGSGVAEVAYTLAGAQSGAATVAAASASVTVSAEGTTVLTAFATDRAGNRSAPAHMTLRIDKTAPTVAYTGNAVSYGVDETVEIRCAASDALSGLAETACRDVAGPARAFAVGANTFSASATDLAGNVGAGSVTFTVGVTADGLCRLTERFATKHGVAQALCVKLGHGQVGAYVNGLRAQGGKALSDDDAALLTRLAGALPTG